MPTKEELPRVLRLFGETHGSNERKVVHYHPRCGRLPGLGVIIRSRRAFDVVAMKRLASHRQPLDAVWAQTRTERRRHLLDNVTVQMRKKQKFYQDRLRRAQALDDVHYEVKRVRRVCNENAEVGDIFAVERAFKAEYNTNAKGETRLSPVPDDQMWSERQQGPGKEWATWGKHD